MTKKKLGMVILNYNDSKTTSILLDNVKDYKCLDLIVIVDNASTDYSFPFLKKLESKKIHVIQTEKNGGVAAGYNFGARYVNQKLKKCNIILSNSDIIIHKEEDLIHLSNAIKDSIALVGPTIVEKNSLNRGWMMPTIQDEIRFNLPLISRKYRKENLYDDKYYEEDISLVGVVSGCFFCVAGEVLEQVGYLDENTFLYYEENILAKKLETIDKQEAIDNKVVIIHNHSVTIDKNVARIKKYKILKTSQRYFVKEYLKASEKELKKLDFTRNLSLIILYIRCFFKGGLKK